MSFLSDIIGFGATLSGRAYKPSGSAPPPGEWPRMCLQPLPPNTIIVKRIKINENNTDFYYLARRLPGARIGEPSLKWVCRVQQGKGSVDPVRTIDFRNFEPQPGTLTRFGENVGSFIQKNKGLAVAAIIGLVVLALFRPTFALSR